MYMHLVKITRTCLINSHLDTVTLRELCDICGFINVNVNSRFILLTGSFHLFACLHVPGYPAH